MSSGTSGAALCLAGGGLEGLLFQLGALRALSIAFTGRSVREFDEYYGVSAGAYAAACLANGISPGTVIRAFEGRSTVLEPITPRVVYDLNYRELLQRGLPLASGLLRPWNYLEIFGRIVKAVPSGICRGDRLERYVAEQLVRAGGSDRFGRVRRPLFIGATDQDSWTHRLFGPEDDGEVRISEAVRASSALVPFYRPKEIHGRLYIDGGFTVTAHAHEAARRGAGLVVVIDPLVPVTTGEVGYIHRRGGLIAGIEGIKAMSHSRFLARYEGLVREHPGTTFILIRPDPGDRKAMAGSPMKFRIRMEIEKRAFETTHKLLIHHGQGWRSAFRRAGFGLDLAALARERQRLRTDAPAEIRRVLTARRRRSSGWNEAHRAFSALEAYLEREESRHEREP